MTEHSTQVYPNPSKSVKYCSWKNPCRDRGLVTPAHDLPAARFRCGLELAQAPQDFLQARIEIVRVRAQGQERLAERVVQVRADGIRIECHPRAVGGPVLDDPCG